MSRDALREDHAVRIVGLTGRRLTWVGVALALAVASCSGENVRVTFLHAQSELSLAYPGATLLKADAQEPGLLKVSDTYVERSFETTDSIQQVGAWYQSQLATRGWVGGLATPGPGPGLTAYFTWDKPGLGLGLWDQASKSGKTAFVVEIDVHEPAWQWASQMQSLREVPEAAARPPGVTTSGAERFDGLALSTREADIWVEHGYRAGSLSREAVHAYYEGALASAGWTEVTTPSLPNDSIITVPSYQWSKGVLVASLSYQRQDSFVFRVDEYLGEAGSPIPKPALSGQRTTPPH